MTRHALWLMALACLLCRVPAARADVIDDFVRARMAANATPGVAVAIVERGRLVRAAGYGFADRDRKIAVTPETVFKIGSVSKQFIASGIMLLVRQGRVRLDDPIDRFFDDLPAPWKAITVRQLLTHTSGLLRESPAFDPLSDKSDAEVVRGAYAEPLRFAPGSKWEYSNVGYYVLGEIIRKASGRPWTEFIDAAIFRPAGMTTSFPTNTTRVVPTMAVGYTGKDNGVQAPPWVALRVSGAFLSTVLDLAKWEAALSAGQVLTRAELDLMWSPVQLNDKSSAPYGFASAPYGFGWHVDRGRGQRRVWHGGGLPGFVSHYVRYPDEGLTVIALTNGDDTDIGMIADGVASLYAEQRKSSATPGASHAAATP